MNLGKSPLSHSVTKGMQDLLPYKCKPKSSSGLQACTDPQSSRASGRALWHPNVGSHGPGDVSSSATRPARPAAVHPAALCLEAKRSRGRIATQRNQSLEGAGRWHALQTRCGPYSSIFWQWRCCWGGCLHADPSSQGWCWGWIPQTDQPQERCRLTRQRVLCAGSLGTAVCFEGQDAVQHRKLFCKSSLWLSHTLNSTKSEIQVLAQHSPFHFPHSQHLQLGPPNPVLGLCTVSPSSPLTWYRARE